MILRPYYVPPPYGTTGALGDIAIISSVGLSV